jgi:hypothetical protein
MTPALTVTLIIGVVGSGGAGVLVGAILTHRRESKRDKASVMVAHAEQLQRYIDGQEARAARQEAHSARQDEQIEGLWNARREDAKVIRAMGDHIDTLESHIWQGKGPPPPARPAGI